MTGSRRWRRARRWTGVFLGAAAVVAIAPGATAKPPDVTPGTPSQVAALVAKSTSITTADRTVLAELPGAPDNSTEVDYDVFGACETATACDFADTTSSKVIVLFGNSHARMWLPALIPVATADKYEIVLVGKDKCPVVDLPLPTNEYSGCTGIVPQSIALINAIKPAVVILADRTVAQDFTAAQWRAGFEKTLRLIEPSRAKLVVIGDIQEFSADPVICVSIHSSAIQADCSMKNPNPREPGYESSEQQAAQAYGATYLNPQSWLCPATKCSPIIGNFVAYWDADHVSASYAAYLATVMGDALKSTLS